MGAYLDDLDHNAVIHIWTYKIAAAAW